MGLIDIDTEAVTLVDLDRIGQVDRPIPVMIRYSVGAAAHAGRPTVARRGVGSRYGLSDAARCGEMHEWLASAIRAFVDAYVRLDPAAVAYLATDFLVQASAGTIDWDTM